MDYKKQQAFQQFCNTYDTLVGSLYSKYQQQSPKLQTHRQTWCKMDRKARGQYIQHWWTEMKPHMDKIERKDATLLTLDLSPILALDLQALWWTGALSKVSKEYLWVYFHKLTENARVWSQVEVTSGEKEAEAEVPTAIAPPPSSVDDLEDLKNIPILKAIYDNVPKSLLENAKKAADELSQKLEAEGGLDPEKMNMGDMTQSILGSMDPEMTQKMVMDMAQTFQTMFQNQVPR
uniref:Uncharacterized protein n=1 Tax=viral metagenome TaxID=1070528 RepID=A0A6C0BQ82_9ZZZZ